MSDFNAEAQRRRGWEVRKAKYLWQQITTPSLSSRKIGLENIESFTGRFIENEAQFEGNGVAFDQGDILYGKLRPYLAKVWVADFPGNAVGDFFVYRLTGGINTRYLKYYLLSPQFTNMANASTYGARMPRVSAEYMANLPIPLPPLPEQKAIVAYLDAETGRIDKAIAAEEKMIALLQERREIVINVAVGGGENFNAEAQRRRGWEERRFGWIMSIKPSISAPHEELLSVFLHKGVIRFIEESEKRTNVTSTDLSKYQLVEPGDFVMNNQQAWRGSVGVSQYRGIVSPAYFVMRLANCLKPDFANYLLRSRSVVSIFERCSRGVGTIQRNLIWDMLKVCRIAFPPLPEQEAIVERLDRETGKIDRAIEVKRRQIELLRERRQIVIDEMVTGKVSCA